MGTLSKVDKSGGSGSAFSDVTGNGYGFEVGAVGEKGLQGFAGLVPGADVSPLPSNGVAEMTGRFELSAVTSIFQVGDVVSGRSFADTGPITLTADYNAGTLKGTATGLDRGSSLLPGLTQFHNGNELVVDGTFDGKDLSGTVTYDGTKGPLTGLVGSDEAIGAFHGHKDTDLHAGGFIVN